MPEILGGLEDRQAYVVVPQTTTRTSHKRAMRIDSERSEPSYRVFTPT